MAQITADIEALISGLQKTDPRLHQAISLISKQLGIVTDQLNPQPSNITFISPTTNKINPPTDFNVLSTGTTVRFTWTLATGASFYEIRRGDNWDTATLVTKTSGSRADIDPLTYGSYTYLIKSLNISGIYSMDSVGVNIIIPQILAVAISPQLIGNNILLNWTTPASVFNINYYILKRDGSLIGNQRGTFVSFFELAQATYVYSITAVDVAGNLSNEAFVSLAVGSPFDYSLIDHHVSDFSGTKTNIALTTKPALICDWTSETYHAHFVGRGYATWQAKIDAGFPIYIQPAATTGSYEEIIDYGSLIDNTLVSITYNQREITPLDLVTVVVKIAVSNDNITYTSFVSGAVQFYAQFRYIKLKLEFSGSNKALTEISNLTVDLSVRRDTDGGNVDALSTDVAGTVATFNKVFKSVDSITVSVQSVSTLYTAIYIFDYSTLNPTTFKVMAFDQAGTRVTQVVSWKARGII